MELTGNATYRDRFGYEKLDTWGPLSKVVTNVTRSVRLVKQCKDRARTLFH